MRRDVQENGVAPLPYFTEEPENITLAIEMLVYIDRLTEDPINYLQVDSSTYKY